MIVVKVNLVVTCEALRTLLGLLQALFISDIIIVIINSSLKVQDRGRTILN